MSRRSVVLERLALLQACTQGLSAQQVERQRSIGYNDIVAPASSGWLVVATLASVGMLVQIPLLSRLLHLRPMHAADWALVASVFAAPVAITLLVASRLTRHPN